MRRNTDTDIVDSRKDPRDGHRAPCARPRKPDSPVNKHASHPRLSAFIPIAAVFEPGERNFQNSLDRTAKYRYNYIRTQQRDIGGAYTKEHIGFRADVHANSVQNEEDEIMTSEKQVAANRENARETFGEEKGDQNHDV